MPAGRVMFRFPALPSFLIGVRALLLEPPRKHYGIIRVNEYLHMPWDEEGRLARLIGARYLAKASPSGVTWASFSYSGNEIAFSSRPSSGESVRRKGIFGGTH